MCVVLVPQVHAIFFSTEIYDCYTSDLFIQPSVHSTNVDEVFIIYQESCWHWGYNSEQSRHGCLLLGAYYLMRKIYH